MKAVAAIVIAAAAYAAAFVMVVGVHAIANGYVRWWYE